MDWVHTLLVLDGCPENCLEVQDMNYGLSADLDNDCRVDFRDFALIAEKWSQCNEPDKPECLENWW